MARFLFLICATAIFIAAGGCKKPDDAKKNLTIEDVLPQQAQPKLQTLKLWIGGEEMITELAITGQQQMTGMMFRTNMAENEGMIFVHPEARQAGYWMKNCPLPLSIGFINPDGVIEEIHELKRHDTNPVASVSTNIRFALETPLGWFQRHNISTGTVVRTERGSLAETFLKQ